VRAASDVDVLGSTIARTMGRPTQRCQRVGRTSSQDSASRGLSRGGDAETPMGLVSMCVVGSSRVSLILWVYWVVGVVVNLRVGSVSSVRARQPWPCWPERLGVRCFWRIAFTLVSWLPVSAY